MNLILGPETQQLINKLDDVGLDKVEATKWLEAIVSEQKALPTHSCSCHAQTKGPCLLCKELGCVVWDFNQVPLFEMDPIVPSRNRRPLIEHRTCEKCGKRKPLNEECFNRRHKNKSGFRGICRKCDV